LSQNVSVALEEENQYDNKLKYIRQENVVPSTNKLQILHKKKSNADSQWKSKNSETKKIRMNPNNTNNSMKPNKD
jgi:hypothetical protein